MNYDAFKERCDAKNLTPTAVVKELGISKANITNWRNGGNPSAEVLVKLADKLDCSVDYLLDVQKTPQRISDMFWDKALKGMLSTSARTFSLRSGTRLSDAELSPIASYVNAEISYLSNDDNPEFTPVAPDRDSVLDENVLFDVLEIMDNCAVDGAYRSVQVQISRIIISNFAKIGITREDLQDEHLDQKKIDYIYSGKSMGILSQGYGFNFSDLTYLRKKLKVSFSFMFTGIK